MTAVPSLSSAPSAGFTSIFKSLSTPVSTGTMRTFPFSTAATAVCPSAV